MKRTLKILICSLLLLTLVCAAGCEAEPKTFTQNGFTITLTDEFEKADYGAYTAAYACEDMFLVALKEDFIYFEGEYGAHSSLMDYASLLIESNDIDAKLTEEDGLVYYTYDIYNFETSELMYTFLAAVYKTEDAFWSVQFAVDAHRFEELKDDILVYARSVSFE